MISGIVAAQGPVGRLTGVATMASQGHAPNGLFQADHEIPHR